MATPTSRLAGLFELQQGPGRNLGMEGLRGIAVSLVFFVHYHSCLELWMADEAGWGARLALALRFVGAAGVDLFFVLSGFLIYGATLSQRFSWGGFLRRRVQRIYPTFLVILSLYLALSFVMPEQSKLPTSTGEAAWYVLQNVLLLPGMIAIPPIVTVAWSLSYEVFFYLALPVLMITLGLRKRARATRIAVACVLAVMIIALPLMGFGHLQFVLFVAGMLVHELRERVHAQAALRGAALSALAMLFAVTALPGAWWLFHAFLEAGALEATAFVARTVWLTVALACVVAVVLTGRGWVARACAWRPLRWLGNMSYSYYLIHGLVLKAVAVVALRLTGPDASHPVAFWLLMPVAYVATVLASGVLFAVIEKPLSLGGGFGWAFRNVPRPIAEKVLAGDSVPEPAPVPAPARVSHPGEPS